MAYKRSRKKQNGGLLPIAVAAVLVLIFLLSGGDLSEILGQSAAPAAQPMEEHLSLHLIDVGDGDCLLVRTGAHNMLIDAGHDGDFHIIQGYLDALGITALDAVLGTHPHEDHIGSMDDVIRMYKPERILLSPCDHTTKHYEDLLDAIIDSGVKAEVPRPGDTIALGDAVMTVLAPIGGDYENINDYSVVLRLNYGGVSMLLTGDAETPSEWDMLNAGRDLSADVLKVGHHGSMTSTSQRFLDAVKPRVAVVSAQKSVAVRERLEKAGIPVYSTSQTGSMVIETDGVSIALRAQRMGEPIVIE